MVQEVLVYLSLIIAIATLVAILTKVIRQPPIIAYLISGVLVGPLGLNLINPSNGSSEVISIFAHIGVAFLLFIVGLSLDFRVLKEVGGVASLGGLLEIVITGTIGALIAIGLGFTSTTILYLATALAFSSTVVVVKILADKKELDTLHGRIALGILIVEDFIAALALMAVPIIKNGGSALNIIEKIGAVLILIAVIFIISTILFSRLLNYLATNQEVLFLFGIAWALLLASLFDSMGFSLEIGALIAGMTLASTKYTYEFEGKMKPLRDFFVVLFFIFFGSQLGKSISIDLIKQAVLLSAFIIIGKPLIVMSVLRIFGYKKKTNFLTGSSLAQISEFSLILILLGFTLGHLSQEIMSLVVLIAIITIGISSYSIYYSHTIFSKIEKFLFFLEGKKDLEIGKKKKEWDIVLIGYHRMGYKILETIKKMKVPYIVVDYNPKVILALNKKGIPCIFGDASDRDFLNQLEIEKSKVIISTIPDDSATFNIWEKLKKSSSQAVFIATTEQPRKALDLYDKGIDYVIIPHHLGGVYASSMIGKYQINKKKYQEEGKKHAKELGYAKKNSAFNKE